MKIIQVMPEFDLAGAEIMCENLIYALKNLGEDVIAVSMFSKKTAITERLEAAGVDVRYLDKKSGLDLSVVGKMRKIFKEEKPDVIHTHRYVKQYAIPAAILAGVKRRVHTVHSVASKELEKNTRKLAKFYYSFCGVTPVALSEVVKKSILEEYKLPSDRVPVVFNGIDLSKCVPKKTYEVGDAFTILHIGRFAEVKNHAMLLRAFKAFHEKKPDSRLVLIGDGELRSEIEGFIAENNMSECVQLMGLQADVYVFLHKADVFALPSLYEGIPMTLIEAMGTGLPIVATRVGGIPDMLENEENALLVDLDDAQLEEAFLRMYNSTRNRADYGKKALEKSTEFSSNKMAEMYIKVYERTM